VEEKGRRRENNKKRFTGGLIGVRHQSLPIGKNPKGLYLAVILL